MCAIPRQRGLDILSCKEDGLDTKPKMATMASWGAGLFSIIFLTVEVQPIGSLAIAAIVSSTYGSLTHSWASWTVNRLLATSQHGLGQAQITSPLRQSKEADTVSSSSVSVHCLVSRFALARSLVANHSLHMCCHRSGSAVQASTSARFVQVFA